MKKTISLFVLAIIMSSCVTTTKYAVYTGMVDFKKYNDKGFFITQSNSVSFEYEPIGYVSAIIFSGYDENQKSTQKKTSLAGVNPGKHHAANNDEAFEVLYEKCTNEGANGIINVDFSTTKDQLGNILSIQANGMAIKHHK